VFPPLNGLVGAADGAIRYGAYALTALLSWSPFARAARRSDRGAPIDAVGLTIGQIALG